MGQIKIVDESGTPVEEKQEQIKAPDTLNAPFTPELQIKAVASVLGIEENAEITRNQDKLSTLLEYAKHKTTDNSLEGLKWALRKLGDRLNTPSSGEKWVDYMSRYAYLELESIKLDEEKRRFKK